MKDAFYLSAVVAQLLICRGISDPQQARRFLNPKLSDLYDPEELPGCTDAAQRIHRAIAARRRIVVYGDYDVDGMTGTALLWRCLKMLGADVGYYIPHRVDEGYGLNREALGKLAEEKVEVVVTVDCGVSSVQEAIAAHHERWDGHGYPRALKGEAIDIAGRIIAAADLIESLISADSNALTARRNLVGALAEHAGGVLDPALAEQARELVRSDSFWLGLHDSALPHDEDHLPPGHRQVQPPEDLHGSGAAPVGLSQPPA